MNVLMFGNCITEKCLVKRKNHGYLEGTARKKIITMGEIMGKHGHKIDIFSSSFSKNSHWLFTETLSDNIRIIHAPTIGLWGITSFFKKTVYILFGIIWVLFHKKSYNTIIFYNFHVEYSAPALFAKFISYIKLSSPLKIIMDYEDGLFLDKGYTGFFYSAWERIIYKYISYYLLVNQGLKKRIEKY